MSPTLEPLSAGAPVLVAGGGITGRAVLAALAALGGDGDTVRRRPRYPTAVRRVRHADRRLGDRRSARR